MTDAERLTRLEERYAHLQRHQTEQDKAVLALTDEVAKLRQELAQLRSRPAATGETTTETDERPPHY
jgi:SlyX protein